MRNKPLSLLGAVGWVALVVAWAAGAVDARTALLYVAAGIAWSLGNNLVCLYDQASPFHDSAAAILTGTFPQNYLEVGGFLLGVVLWPLGVFVTAVIFLAMLVVLAATRRRGVP